MAKVLFVTKINFEYVEKMSGRDYVTYADLPSMPSVVGTDDILLTDTIKTKCVPIIQLCGIGKPNVYLAYSTETEQILGIPIRAILRSQRLAEHTLMEYSEKLSYICNLSFINRIRFVLGLRYTK